jgi:5-methylcytosine-specific restriction endonuclease McrBC regulatory subunit McrC
MDNQPNRVLLHALHGAQRLVRDHAGFENTEINRRLLRHRRKFAAVTHERVRPSQLNQLESLPTAFDGYEQSNALKIARYIIEETDLGIETGDYESIELTAVMWRLFENAFAQVVADKLDVNRDDIAQDNWTYQIDQDNEISIEQDEDDTEEKTAYKKKQMQPDIYLPSDEVEENSKAIVADTKWKRIAPFFENKKTVENDDLFQITTYRDVAAQMDDDGEAVGFLVYPFTAENDCSEVPRHQISLSGVPESVGNGDWEDIYMIGWQVGTTGDGTECDLRDSAEETIDKMIETAKDSN